GGKYLLRAQPSADRRGDRSHDGRPRRRALPQGAARLGARPRSRRRRARRRAGRRRRPPRRSARADARDPARLPRTGVFRAHRGAGAFHVRRLAHGRAERRDSRRGAPPAPRARDHSAHLLPDRFRRFPAPQRRAFVAAFILRRRGECARDLPDRTRPDAPRQSGGAGAAGDLSDRAFAFAALARIRRLRREIRRGASRARGRRAQNGPRRRRRFDARREPPPDAEIVQIFRAGAQRRRSRRRGFRARLGGLGMSLAAGTQSVAFAGGYRRAADFFELTKPRVTLMVLVTTFVGFYLAADSAAGHATLIATLIGTALASGGTLALNQYMERRSDALMERTRRRPLPDGRILPAEALFFGIVLAAAGIALLALAVNVLSACVT